MTTSIYDITLTNARGEQTALSSYKGQALLIVNVASACGFTPQYEGLEKLYQTYRDRGLHLLAFPCNDFGQQEPGTIAEIQSFCSLNYGITFEIFDKLHCIGDERHPLYTWLVEQSESKDNVQWNFEKFLIDRSGALTERYSSKVTPNDEALIRDVERVLA